MNKLTRKYGILGLLVLLFAAPGLAAYLFYLHPQWLTATKTNRGQLLNPPVLLTSLEGDPHWHIIYLNKGPCTRKCMKKLDQLARTRLALGRKLYQVGLNVIIDSSKPTPPNTLAWLKTQDIHVLTLSPTDEPLIMALSQQKSGIWIVNPNQYVVLAYRLKEDPAALYHDLKKLVE